MANVKISELPAASTLDGTETIPVVQGATAKKATAQAIADLVTVPAAYTNEEAVDAVAAAIAAGTHSRVTITYDDAAGTLSFVVDAAKLAPVAATFTGAADAYFPVHEALTLNIAGAVTAGTGTFTYAKALAAIPTSFSAITTSTTFAAGDVLKITAASVTGYCAVTLPRTA
jgi:hypothetical protein